MTLRPPRGPSSADAAGPKLQRSSAERVIQARGGPTRTPAAHASFVRRSYRADRLVTRGHGVEDEAVARIRRQHAFVGLVDIVGSDEFRLGEHVVVGAEVESLRIGMSPLVEPSIELRPATNGMAGRSMLSDGAPSRTRVPLTARRFTCWPISSLAETVLRMRSNCSPGSRTPPDLPWRSSGWRRTHSRTASTPVESRPRGAVRRNPDRSSVSTAPWHDRRYPAGAVPVRGSSWHRRTPPESSHSTPRTRRSLNPA